MKLSKTEKAILNSYKLMLDGLANYLGEGYEFVLHSLENYDHSAIKVINGYFSGRTEGAPITDLALSMLMDLEKNDENHQYKSYFNRTDKGEPIQSCTISIIGENNRIIGLLCINFYLNVPLYSVLSKYLGNRSVNTQENEIFPSNIEELISKAVEDALYSAYNNVTISSSDKNKEIVTMLFNKGIFNLKDAVSLVARRLGVSKNTVYLHLRNLSELKPVGD